jgi:Secretion system C-terminal sorting domain
MKKLFTLLSACFIMQFSFAATGIYETYMSTSLNGAGQVYFGTGGSNPSFAGQNLGTITSMSNTLVFKLRGVNTFQDNGSVVNFAAFNYRVYKVGSTAPAYTTVLLTLQGASGNNKFWNDNAPDISLLSSPSMQPGTYNVDIFFGATTNSVNTPLPIVDPTYTATFTLAVALGAEMTSFSAKKSASSTELSWLTASEKDNATFQIERSANATNFSPIGEVKGAGNSNAVNNYTFTDATPLSGVNYYRLKAVDFNGSATLSKVVSVNFVGKGGDKTAVYPNPTHDVLRVDFTATEASTTTLQVTDLLGRVLLSQNVSVAKGANLVPFNVSSLPSGAYLLKANGDVTRFVKM